MGANIFSAKEFSEEMGIFLKIKIIGGFTLSIYILNWSSLNITSRDIKQPRSKVDQINNNNKQKNWPLMFQMKFIYSRKETMVVTHDQSRIFVKKTFFLCCLTDSNNGYLMSSKVA